jgi:Ca2+-binding EF-hand superfamily protein
MHDADTNLEAFDKRINKLYMKLEDSFHLFDKDGSGEVDRKEFLDVMDEMNTRMNLKLSDTEIKDLFKQADSDGGGSISYSEFVRGFAGAGQRRFIPEVGLYTLNSVCTGLY